MGLDTVAGCSVSRAPSFPDPEAGRVVVVGAGTAGCVVAGRLAEAGYAVDLLDAGPMDFPSGDERLSATDHLQAHGVDDRWWPATTVFRGDGNSGEPSVPYLAGRGLGGSSAVNGLLADIDPDDPALGPPDEVRAAIERCRLPIERPGLDELGDLDRALLLVPGARVLDLHRSDGRRADIALAYLRGGGDVRVIGDALVDRVAERSAVGGITTTCVTTSSGDEFAASAVVLCAGTLHTPAILQRSRIGLDVGIGIQGHPAVSIPLVRRPPVRRCDIVTGVAVDRGRVQLLALDHVSSTSQPADGPEAALLVALMQPIAAAGTVEIVSDDPLVEPLVRLRSFADRRDLVELRRGVRWALDTAVAELAEPIGAIAAQHHGHSLVDLGDDELSDWIRAEPGAHAHLVGGCSLGRTLDHDGRVVGASAAYVADASAFPRVPRTGPHLPTIVQAERLVARWCRAKMGP